MCRATQLLVVALAFFALALEGAASASAAVRLKHDKNHETRFFLNGTSLTVTVVDLPRYSQHPPTLDQLLGRDVRAACGTSFRRYTLKTVARSLKHWPAGTRSMRFTLIRDVSRAAKWCLIEGGASEGDIASVSFARRSGGGC